MSIRGFNKKIFLISLFLTQGVAKGSWESLYEEYEHSDNKNLYLYPIDINTSYAVNFSTRFKTIDKYIQKDNKEEVLFHLDNDKKRYLKGFLNHGFRVDCGVLMTGYGFARKLFCFPRIGIIYQHLFFNMKLKENGFVDDLIFYFSPVTSPTATFEIAPRFGLGLSYIYLPREYYSKLQKEEDGVDENGNTKWKIKNDDPVDNFLYHGLDLAFSLDLIFKLRFCPEWSLFSTIGGVWHPLLFKKGVLNGKNESSLKKDSFNQKTINALKKIEGGFGTIGLSLGLNYNFKPALEKPEWYNKFLRSKEPKVKFKLEFIQGLRNIYNLEKINDDEGSDREMHIPVAKSLSGITGGAFKTLLQYSNFQALGFGIGVLADFARKLESKTLSKGGEWVNIHAALIHEFIFNKFIFENLLGVNLKTGDKIGPGPAADKTIMGRLFWNPSFNFKFNSFLFIGIGAHIGIFSVPLECKNSDSLDGKNLKNKADLLKLEYFNLSLGLDCSFDTVYDYNE